MIYILLWIKWELGLNGWRIRRISFWIGMDNNNNFLSWGLIKFWGFADIKILQIFYNEDKIAMALFFNY